jgi:hypothetical protein
MKRWKGPECEIGIRNPDTRRQLRLDIERTSEGIDRKAFGLEFGKGATGMSSGLQQMRNWALWRGRPPPKRKEKLASNVSVRGAGYVGAPATPGVTARRGKTGIKMELELPAPGIAVEALGG